ncbi:MAG: hypothetical protein R2851_20545 [Caldilineaceae bacterium]
MPFKRNPIVAENIDSLTRLVAALPRVAWDNAALSLLERTLDDSANRRLFLPEAFLLTDEVLTHATRLVEGMRFWPGPIALPATTASSPPPKRDAHGGRACRGRSPGAARGHHSRAWSPGLRSGRQAQSAGRSPGGGPAHHAVGARSGSSRAARRHLRGRRCRACATWPEQWSMRSDERIHTV